MYRTKRFSAKYRLILSRVMMLPLLAAILLTSSRWESNRLLAAGLFCAGCVLIGVASIGRLWSSLYLCGYKRQSLVTVGPYSMCRNPLYLFSLVGAVGVGFITETFTVPLVILALFAVYYPWVIRAEEVMLAEIHGEAFRTYAAEVPRFWPRRLRVDEPEEYVVRPRLWRRIMFDALWFIWILGVLELVKALRATGVIPTLATLP